MEAPYVMAICPTYNRPGCIANVLAMWGQQTYGNCNLLIYDDANQYVPQADESHIVISVENRHPTLGAKFATAIELGIQRARHLGVDLKSLCFAMFEDDDVYFPHYIESHARTLARESWSSPRRLLANDGVGKGRWHTTDGQRRHHGAWAFSLNAYVLAGGYSSEDSWGFDLKFGARLAGAVGEPVATDAAGKGPICLYRWMTASKNGSGMGEAAMMSSQPNYEGPKIRVPDPEFDAETADYYSEFGNIAMPSTCCGG